ncbi:MAG: transglutaminase family protein [Methylophilaceae bacterium]|nr:transglutaminase family protein [Methylophilaceae bacterium]
MLLNIEHHTRYAYDTPVGYTIQQLRLTPQNGFGQRVKRWELRVNGHAYSSLDAHGNTVHTLVVDTPHQGIEIIARGEVETGLDIPPPPSRLPLEVYLRSTELTAVDETLAQFARQFSNPDAATLHDMMQAIRDRVPYQRGITGVHTSAAEAFRAKGGVCQDHAHVFIACCRHLGVPARYVSGYLFTADDQRVESHAWVDAWLDGVWYSLDVSSGQRANGVHVRLATGLDYRDACPIAGVRLGGSREQMAVHVQISQQ